MEAIYFRPQCANDSDVIVGAMTSQITSLTIVYSLPVNSAHKWPVTRKMLSFDYVIME